MKKIAAHSDIKSLIVDVSEEITPKNILNFAHTSLDINNIVYSSSDIIYCNFLKYSKEYQVLVFNNSFEHMIIEVLNYKDKEIDKLKHSITFILYITKTFFVIYENTKLYTYQLLNHEYTRNELLEFIYKNFNITICEIKELNEIELENNIESLEKIQIRR